MKHPSTILLCCVALSIGLVVGSAIDSWSPGSPAQAELQPALASGPREPVGARPDHPEAYASGSPEENVLQQASRQLAGIARQAAPSVVHIQSTRRSPRGVLEETGSGVIVASRKAEGYFVVTNRHVVADADPEDISIHVYDGRTLRPAAIWSDRASDVAVVKLDARGLTPAGFADSDRLEIGNMVLAIGSPFGLSKSVTMGIISAKGRRSLAIGRAAGVLNQDFLQTDAAINPGNSGGPLIDLDGRIVGINTAIASGGGGNDGIGFSIPSNLVKNVVDQLLEHGKVQRAYLGVQLDGEFTPREARSLGLDRPRGARIVKVYAETPAERIGLEIDDVILSFDGVDVQDDSHLINLVSLTPVGKEVRLVVVRNGERLTITAPLGDRETLEQR